MVVIGFVGHSKHQALVDFIGSFQLQTKIDGLLGDLFPKKHHADIFLSK